MASKNVSYLFILSFLLAMKPESSLGAKSGLSTLNSIDTCWRKNPNWMNKREELAKCSTGFAGKMINNIGKDMKKYVVTDPSDNAMNPQPGTLRYGVTMVPGKVWISFQKDMDIKLERTLILGNYTTIDGRGAIIHISNGGLMLYKVNNVIIHGLRIHDCQPQPAGNVMGPGSKLQSLSKMDGDAIRLLGATKVWIDHNTLSKSQDGLIDVTLGSTYVTISNNWFRDHDKVMLLGHDDDYKDDKNMKVTVVYNRFGPNCHQRMPRVRHGYAHVANNIYLGWEIYAIGGSMNPSIKSESNLFVAPQSQSKKVIMNILDRKNGQGSNFKSVGDILENGANFNETGSGFVKPNYKPEELFPVESGKVVRQLTRSAGALRCQGGSIC